LKHIRRLDPIGFRPVMGFPAPASDAETPSANRFRASAARERPRAFQ